MFLWFIGTTLTAMWFTFRDPAIDHRLLVCGALLPDVVDGLTGQVPVLHTLAAPIVVMMALMICTIGKRRLRRQLLAIPIGLFWHLVFDGAWMNTSAFWWPFTGFSLNDSSLSIAERPLMLLLAMELLGLALVLWNWHLMGLRQSDRRQLFMRSGRLDPGLTHPRAAR